VNVNKYKINTQDPVAKEHKLCFSPLVKDGVKAGVPIALGYIPIAITFGMISQTSGIPNFITVMMSIIVFAGASQFISVEMMAAGASVVEIIITTFILNFRHFLMSSSLCSKIKGNTQTRIMNIVAFGITDETFAVASLQKQSVSQHWLLGLNFTAHFAWVAGTIVGIYAGNILPEVLRTSMGIALYAMFIALLIPSLKKARKILIVSLLSAVISGLLFFMPLLSFITSGWRIIISTVVAAAIGAKMNESGEEADV